MTTEKPYSIGDAGKKWGAKERGLWLAQQSVKRRYSKDVLARLTPLSKRFDVIQYGALSFNPSEYPLYLIKGPSWDTSKPTALITGGVHGYETSGVLGAIRFLQTSALDYSEHFNIAVTPCISPWGYETINRWNPKAIDPNRSFVDASKAEESAALMQCVAELETDITVHIDLHETTDTDNSEFRPALAARDNVEHAIWDIPDGFYLVGDSLNPTPNFQAHIIKQVSKVTHIAPADADGRIIGEKIAQDGVINYPTKALGLCTGFTDSQYSTTTEVYPDSPRVDGKNCINAQVMAVTSGLDYIIGAL